MFYFKTFVLKQAHISSCSICYLYFIIAKLPQFYLTFFVSQ